LSALLLGGRVFAVLGSIEAHAVHATRRALAAAVRVCATSCSARVTAQRTLVALARRILTQLLGEREYQILLGGAHLVDVAVSRLFERLEHLLDEHLGYGCPASDAHGVHAVQPRLLHLVGI